MQKQKTPLIYGNFYDYLSDRIVQWALKLDSHGNKEFRWKRAEQEALERDISTPPTKEIATLILDNKFKLFFLSIARNGINKADLDLFYKYKNELPLKQFGLVYDLQNFSKSGERLVSKNKLPMGYYMVEIKATLRNPAERTVVYFFSGLSNENAQFVLPLHSERITKRLIKLDQASFLGITCKLSEHENASIISSLKIVRVARSFFLDRIFKKMGLKRSSDFYQEISEEDLNAYFQQYDNFLSNSGFDDATYELFLKEEASDPALNTKRHLRKMKQWGIR